MREENRRLLTAEDVIFAVHPGSGTSWIGSLLITLGVFYVSGHHEVLVNGQDQKTGGWIEDNQPLLPGRTAEGPGAGSARPLLPVAEMVRHNPILHSRERRNPGYREALRVIQTNDSPRRFTRPIKQKVILLIRDGRDTVISLYHWFRNFTDLDLPLADYLSGNSGAWPAPAMSWAFFNLSWLKAVDHRRLHVVRFEGCREEPRRSTRDLLAFLGLERSDRAIDLAIEESSYGSMRKMEDRLASSKSDRPGVRVMRKGQIGEWRGVLDTEMLETFSGLPVQALEKFGYDV